MTMKETIIVDKSMLNMRLDQIVAHVTKISRSKVKRLIDENLILLNGEQAKASSTLCLNDYIEYDYQEEVEIVPQAENISLDLLFEDDYLLILNKPAGLVVHPGAGNHQGTLLNGLLGYNPIFSELDRAGIIHRLDKDTSGVLVIAKTSSAQKYLQSEFKLRNVNKEYTALIYGIPKKTGRLEHNLGRHPINRKKQAVINSGGKVAISHFNIEASFSLASQVGIKISTGRTHQIRVQMAHIGHAVIGDKLYGNRKYKKIVHVDRHMLHASKISFMHPNRKECLSFEAPLPNDMVDCIEKLRGSIS